MSWFRRNTTPRQAATVTPEKPAPTAEAAAPAATPAPAQPAPASMPASTAFAATMMEFPLTLTSIFDRAMSLFADRSIVTVQAEGVERTTYGAMGERTLRLAAALARLGVGKGDRVATLAWNNERHFQLYFAVPCMGAVLHTLNLRLPSDQLGFIIRDAGDKVIAVDSDLLPLLAKVQGDLGSVKQIIVLNGTASDIPAGLPPVAHYDELLASAPATFTWPKLNESDAAAMCYTSGTTDNPKGVVYSHRSSYLHAQAVTMADTIALSERDIAYPLVPMFHVNAWGLPHAAAMVGTRVVFPNKFMDPNRVAQIMADEGVTIAAGVPTLWIGLVQVLEKRPELDLSRVTRIVCGGSAAPQALIEGLAAHNLTLLHAWGMTETSPIGTVSHLKSTLEDLPLSEQFAYRAKQGIPVPGVELRLVDIETGDEVPHDGVRFGEIEVRGPWITNSYYHAEGLERGSDKFDGEWFRTGDVATMDAQGYIQIVDRTKDVIKSGGEWISSVQLESLIMGHPQVLEAAVVGLPHPKWQERPVAVVVVRPDAQGQLTPEAITEYLEPRVAKWWLPDRILIVESIPKTSVGKFDKKVLRAQLAKTVTLGE